MKNAIQRHWPLLVAAAALGVATYTAYFLGA
jgi:hypothetical protein